jgi:hypothetical protein
MIGRAPIAPRPRQTLSQTSIPPLLFPPSPPGYVSRRQHTSAYVGIRQQYVDSTSVISCGALCVWSCSSAALASTCAEERRIRRECVPAVSIRQHTSAYVSISQHTSAYVSIRQHTSCRREADPECVCACSCAGKQ